MEGAWIWNPQRAPKGEPEPRHESAGSYGVVYANGAAYGALRAGKTGAAAQLPYGSVIVRETVADPNGGKPVRVVAMVKRARGFNPKGGDWEFLNIDPSLAKVEGRQKKGSCLDCHASQRETDFVFPVPAVQTFVPQPRGNF